MNLNSLPKAGMGFRASAGSGNLKYKLSRLTANRGGEFGNLHDNQDHIFKAIDKYSGVIKSRGGLNRMQQKSIIHAIKSEDGDLSYDDKKDLKKIVSYYSRKKTPPEPEIKKIIKLEPEQSKVRIPINRADSDFNNDQDKQIKDRRVSEARARLRSGNTGVASSGKPTPPKPVTPPAGPPKNPYESGHHEQINFN